MLPPHIYVHFLMHIECGEWRRELVKWEGKGKVCVTAWGRTDSQSANAFGVYHPVQRRRRKMHIIFCCGRIANSPMARGTSHQAATGQPRWNFLLNIPIHVWLCVLARFRKYIFFCWVRLVHNSLSGAATRTPVTMTTTRRIHFEPLLKYFLITNFRRDYEYFVD